MLKVQSEQQAEGRKLGAGIERCSERGWLSRIHRIWSAGRRRDARSVLMKEW
jgi:hypothetical protein